MPEYKVIFPFYARRTVLVIAKNEEEAKEGILDGETISETLERVEDEMFWSIEEIEEENY